MPQSPFGPYTPANTGTMESWDCAEMLHERVPAFADAVWAMTMEQVALASKVVGDEKTHESVRLLFNLAVNDVRDLLGDLSKCSGRSAMRAARAVIEHAVNMHTVAGSLVEAHRYAEHLDQGPALAFELQTGATRLDGPTRKSYLHALRKTGSAANARFEGAVRNHGSWFRRGWTQANLSDRSTTEGLEHIYRYYKLASLVTHGSAGGSLGTLHNHPKGFRTFRTGPALELAPLAMWAGLAGYREVLNGLSRVYADLPLDGFTGGLDSLDALWGDYFVAVTEIDHEMWPTEPVRQPTTVLAFTQTKKRRWFLHLPVASVLLRATEPDLSDEMETDLASMIDDMVESRPDLFRNDQRWLTAAMLHVDVTPDGTGRWLPDTALMDMPPNGWETRTVERPS